MAEQVNVLLYGLGSIGSFYAFILDRSDRVRLTVVARSNYDAVQENGLQINSDNHGDHHFFPKVVKTSAEAGETFDYVVCTHKAIDQSSVPTQLAPAVDESKTCIVIIQNGVGNEELFRDAFPRCSIISCVTWVRATQLSPGVVRHIKSENTQLGIFPNNTLDTNHEQNRLDEFASLLREGGTPLTVEANIQVQRWEKVVWNVAWNSLTTLTMVDTHSWLKSSSDAVPLTRRLMGEVIDVARKADVPLEHDLIDEFMDRILAMPPIGSSMQVDCKMGRPMEIEVILGTPVRKGRELGVAIPTLDTLYAVLQGINSRFLKPEQHS